MTGRRGSSRATPAISKPTRTPGTTRCSRSGDVIEVGCWAHARRKFYEARTTDPRHSHVALAYIRRLYIVESDAKEAKLDDDARRALRQERSVPILEELFTWLEGVRARCCPGARWAGRSAMR